MNTHAVLGNGSAPAKVIQEGLRDILKDGDSISIGWYGKPTPGTEVVYDHILDNSVPFFLFYTEGDVVPKVFRDAGVVQKVRDVRSHVLQALEGTGAVLFLWDAEAPDEQVDIVFDTVPEGSRVLELTNGLCPIIADDGSIPEPQEPHIVDDADDEVDTTSRFSKDELEVMTALAVKRYGVRMGTTATTKVGIIHELFPDDVPAAEEDSQSAVPALEATRLRDYDTMEMLGDLQRSVDALSKSLTALTERLYPSKS